MSPEELSNVQELHQFLQGHVPKGGYRVEHPPELDEDTAWTVVWFISSQYHQYSDAIERCDLCKSIYDSEREGACLDYGEGPFFFCYDCTYTPEFETKQAADPDREVPP